MKGWNLPNTAVCCIMLYWTNELISRQTFLFRGADMSLARPGLKQATAIEDFDVNISYL